MGIVSEDVDIGRVSITQLGRNSKHINDAVFQTPSAQHLPQAIPTRSWPRTGGAARGWPEKTNPGDGDRKSVDERNLGAASPPHGLLPQPQPPQVRRKRDSTVEIGWGGGDQSGVDAEAETPAKQPTSPAHGRDRESRDLHGRSRRPQHNKVKGHVGPTCMAHPSPLVSPKKTEKKERKGWLLEGEAPEASK